MILDLPTMHWAVAGASIAALTLLLAFVFNRRLGFSSGFEDVCSLAISLPYFRRAALLADRPWRLPLVIGLFAGGALSAGLAGTWTPTWEAGLLDERLSLGPAGKVLWMFGGGLLIGFGTRLGGGCTSGHGVFGMSNLEIPSIVTTVSFMLGGVLTTHLIYRVLLP